MIDHMTAIIYGIIQGFTEFLPISSSGHLALLPKVMDFSDPGVVFDLSMHVGTALAVFLYFFKDIKNMVIALFRPNEDRKTFHLSINMIIATISSILLIFLLKDYAKEYGRQLSWICFQLSFFGILMVIMDRRGTSQETSLMDAKFDWKRSLLIGLSQSLAVFPGVSRSGITLTMARSLGLSRLESTRFSFLLSLPIILGGFVYKIKDVQGQSLFQFDVLILGIVISFIVGILTIHFFLKYVNKFGLFFFGLYRVLIAMVLYFVFIQ